MICSSCGEFKTNCRRGETSLSFSVCRCKRTAVCPLDKKGTIPALRLFLSWRNGGGARDLITAAAAPDVSRCPAHQLTAVCVLLRARKQLRVSPPAQKLHRRVRVETVNLIFSSKPTAAKHSAREITSSVFHLLSRSLASTQILLFYDSLS